MKGRKKIIGFIIRLFVISLFFLFALSLDFSIFDSIIIRINPNFLDLLSILLFLFILLFISISILGFYVWGNTQYYVLKKFLHINAFGWKRIPLSEIKEVEIKQDPIERMFNIGRVFIYTKEGRYMVSDVQNPKNTEILILKKISGKEIDRYGMI